MATSSDDDRRPARRDNRFVLIPALTFVVGLLLGGLLVWVGTDMGETDPAEPADVAASPEATTGEDGEQPGNTQPTDVTVTVPAECVQAAEQAQEVLSLAQQAAEAIGDLDAQRLRSLVDEMEQLEPAIRASSGECQDAREG